MICTFFGHRDCPGSVESKLLEAIRNQIEQGVLQFYVGNHGRFDAMALSCLRNLKKEYENLCYFVILAYLPTNPNSYLPGETIFPEGIELAPKRFAIDYCNRWMVSRADTVISYITHSWGGAEKYVRKAKKRGAMIFNLAND